MASSTVELVTNLTLGATLKAHKYSNQEPRQHLCVYKTALSPVGQEFASEEHEAQSPLNHPYVL